MTPEGHLYQSRRLRRTKNVGPGRQGRSVDQVDVQLAAVEPHRRWSSRQLHRLGDIASHAWTGAVVALIVLVWLAYGSSSGFPSYWPTVLESATSIVTVFMVFAIQHLQARDQIVTQRKLDEVLRAVPRADNKLIAVEHAV